MPRFVYLIFIFLLIAGCSITSPSASKPPSPPKQTTPEQNITFKRPLTATEKMLMNPPGTYSGQNYNEALVNKELDKLPNNISAEQYTDKLLSLLREDYRPSIPVFVNFDPSVTVNITQPSERMKKPLPPDNKKIHFSILLDASGSMAGKVGNKTKMEIAKQAVTVFIGQLPSNSTVSLRVYGHKGSGSKKDKSMSCSSSEEIYHEQGNQPTKLNQALAKVKPMGWTPIAKALESVQADRSDKSTETIVYVVSDGIETCGGDPVLAARVLANSHIKTIVNIIGFDVDNKGQQLLKQVAHAGNGQFSSVNDEQSLYKYFTDQYDALAEEWLAWRAAGQSQAIKIKEQKQKQLFDAKENIKSRSATEKAHLKAAQKYLATKWNSNQAIDQVFSLIIDRYGEIFGYAVDTYGKLWKQATKNGWDVHDQYTKKGREERDKVIDQKKQMNP